MDPNAHPEVPAELTAIPSAVPASSVVSAPLSMLVCSYCHQPILSSYYFCPNCGTKIGSGELSTSPQAQAWIYIFSIILPMMCYIFVTRWQGLKYYRSSDPKTRQIGLNAIVLLSLSTIVTLWLGYVWAQEFVQSQVASINAGLNADMGP